MTSAAVASSDTTTPSVNDQDSIVTYLITVHGMGEQRQHDTSLPIINRLAECRGRDGTRPIKPGSPWYVATREGLLGATGVIPESDKLFEVDTAHGASPWTELEALPVQRPEKPIPAAGAGRSVPPEAAGTCLRVVDLVWSDILRELHPYAASSTDAWARALVFRLLHKREPATPYHIRKLMEVLAGTLTLTSRILGIRWPKLRHVLFDQYLGDVQLYAEYGETRGRAVRRFHEWMTRIDYMHCVREQDRIAHLREQGATGPLHPREARYIIVAHSLGTVLTIDALFSAALPVHVRCGMQAGLRDWPWRGYIRNRVPNPEELEQARKDRATWTAAATHWQQTGHYETAWISRVDRLITLGSPIDKFLALWWENYRYLCEDAGSSRWEAQSLLTAGHRIVHDNYCDEQDPVGGPLDILRTSRAYQAVFETERARSGEDILYSFNAVPGLAHMAYFEHSALWQRILDRAVDKSEESHQEPAVALSRPAAFPWILVYSYLLWPLIGTGVLYYAYRLIISDQHQMHTIDWQLSLVWGIIIGALGLWYGRRFIELTLWWRQLLKSERSFRKDLPMQHVFASGEIAFQHAIVLLPITSLMALLGYDFPGWLSHMECIGMAEDYVARVTIGAQYAGGCTIVALAIAFHKHFTAAPVHVAVRAATSTDPKQETLNERRLRVLLRNDVVPLVLLALILGISICSPLDRSTRAWLYWTALLSELGLVCWIILGTIILPGILYGKRLKSDPSVRQPDADETLRGEPQPTSQRHAIYGRILLLLLLLAPITWNILPKLPSVPFMYLDQRAVGTVCAYLFIYWTAVKFWEIKERLWQHTGKQPSVSDFAAYAGCQPPAPIGPAAHPSMNPPPVAPADATPHTDSPS